MITSFLLFAALSLSGMRHQPIVMDTAVSYVSSGGEATKEGCAALAAVDRTELVQQLAGEGRQQVNCSTREEAMEYENALAMADLAIARASRSCAARPMPGTPHRRASGASDLRAVFQKSEKLCKRPTWGSGEPVDAREAVMWSAALWAVSRDSKSVTTPCGGGLSCSAVPEYVRKLGGKIETACGGDCAVYWIPEGAEQ